MKQKGEDIASIEKLLEKGTLWLSSYDHTDDNQISQVHPYIRWIRRPAEKRLQKREIPMRHFCGQSKHSLSPQDCLDNGSWEQNRNVNSCNDDGENDESIAQTPYFRFRYLAMSSKDTRGTTLKPNSALCRTLTQKVNTARITVRKRIYSVTGMAMRIRPHGHCDCVCDTPREWDRSLGTGKLFLQIQEVPATWTMKTRKTASRPWRAIQLSLSRNGMNLMESRGFAPYQMRSHFCVCSNVSRFGCTTLLSFAVVWWIVIIVGCFLGFYSIFCSAVVVHTSSQL